MAKLIVKLIHSVAEVVNRDPEVGDRLKVTFLANYQVSLAEKIIPAAELSEQISTAGTEASGTGNMKMALNGALTIGTLDGANVEIRDAVGDEQIFIFGLSAAEAQNLRRSGYDPWRFYEGHAELRAAIDMIRDGFFSPDRRDLFHPLFDSMLRHGDRYLVMADFTSYLASQERVDKLYRNPDAWTRKAILSTARMGRFSSDRTVQEYAREVWGLVV